MTAWAVLPLRVDQKAAEPIGSDFANLYSLLAGWFGGIPRDAVPANLTTIPVPLDSDGVQALQIVQERLATPAIGLVVIDLANSVHTVLPSYSIINSVIEVCEKATTETGQRPLYIFLLRSQLWPSDPAMAIIHPLVAAGSAFVVADNGELNGLLPTKYPFRPEEYISSLARARTPPLQLLRQKLVRWHGHFKRERDGKHDHCVHYYFDGSECTIELAHLISEKLKQGTNATGVGEMVLHAGGSSWLSGAAEAVAMRLDLPVIRLDTKLELPLQIDNLSDNPTIVLSMCDTGRTCTALIRQLLNANPTCMPRIITILTTKGREEQNSTRIHEIDDRQYEIEYLLRVRQPHFLVGQCRQCRVRTPGSLDPPGRPDRLKVETHQMWSMILEAGLKAEEDVPIKVRPSLGLVPDFPKIVSLNGPYLACKMHAELSAMDGRLPRNPIIVCPDEQGARVLSDALTGLFKYTVVCVPRPSLGKTPQEFSETEKEEDWCIQLESLRDRNDRTEVIVMDEFNASGGTRLALRSLTENFGLTHQSVI